MSLPQRTATPAPARRPIARPGYGMPVQARPVGVRPVGVRPQPGTGPLGQPRMGVRPGAGYPVAPRPVAEPPAPRPAVTFLTVAEVASMMRVSKMTVYRLVHNGDLAAVRVGRSFRVPAPAVRAYLQEGRTDVA